MTLADGEASAQAVLARALAWIEAEPTQVVSGSYTVNYARGAQIGGIQVATEGRGEPIVPWPCWWTAEGDYYYQPPDGPLYHVTTAMAEDMLTVTYPEAEAGVLAVATINMFADPHRLLSEAQPVGEPQPGEGGASSIRANVSGEDLIGLSLPADLLPRYTAGVRYDLEVSVAPDGAIVGMAAAWAGTTEEPLAYEWTRTTDEPALPGTWVDLDQATLEKALREGWRASPADAAADVDFPVFWLGESYEGLRPLNTHVDGKLAVLIEYGGVLAQGPAGGSTTTTLSPAGYILFQYSADDVPESEKSFVAEKTLIGEYGAAAESYAVYRTPKGQPGRSVLVKMGETYVSISATQGGGDVTEQLLRAAAALRLAAEAPTR